MLLLLLADSRAAVIKIVTRRDEVNTTSGIEAGGQKIQRVELKGGDVDLRARCRILRWAEAAMRRCVCALPWSPTVGKEACLRMFGRGNAVKKEEQGREPILEG